MALCPLPPSPPHALRRGGEVWGSATPAGDVAAGARCVLCASPRSQTLPIAGRPPPRHPSAGVGIPGYRGGSPRDARHSPPRARCCSRQVLWGAPPPGLTGVLELVAGSPSASWRSRLPQEEPSSPPRSPVLRQSSVRRQVGSSRAGCAGPAQGGSPTVGSVQGQIRSPAPQPSQPFLPAPTPLHGHSGKCQRTGFGRGEGQVSGQKPAHRGAAWSRDACPLWKGLVGGAGRLRCSSSSVGLVGRLGGHCWPCACWAMGATRTVFVWNMDEAPFIKLEFWEMTHGLASYTS